KDLNIDRAIQLRRPLLQAYAQSPASKCIRSIAGRLAEKAAAGKHTENKASFTDIFFQEGDQLCSF
ncbi:MAG: hypothetical protein GY868_02580, partial [Deltaproteobacteria bacterium]|nr:hypothetical protein [Deltaproteobacteria bacterium]